VRRLDFSHGHFLPFDVDRRHSNRIALTLPIDTHHARALRTRARLDPCSLCAPAAQIVRGSPCGIFRFPNLPPHSARVHKRLCGFALHPRPYSCGCFMRATSGNRIIRLPIARPPRPPGLPAPPSTPPAPKRKNRPRPPATGEEKNAHNPPIPPQPPPLPPPPPPTTPQNPHPPKKKSLTTTPRHHTPDPKPPPRRPEPTPTTPHPHKEKNRKNLHKNNNTRGARHATACGIDPCCTAFDQHGPPSARRDDLVLVRTELPLRFFLGAATGDSAQPLGAGRSHPRRPLRLETRAP